MKIKHYPGAISNQMSLRTAQRRINEALEMESSYNIVFPELYT